VQASRDTLFGRSPLLYWIVVASLLLGAAAVSFPFEHETRAGTGALALCYAVALLVGLVLWPYHRIPVVRRLLAGTLGAGAVFLVAESWEPDEWGRALFALVFLALPLLGYAARGDWSFLWRWASPASPGSGPPARPNRYLVEFSTTRFDLSAEPANDINPIGGRSYLTWVTPRLEEAGYEVSQPGTEDWGWYVEAARAGDRYLVGASALAEEPGRPVDWTVQVLRRRTLSEWLLGRGRITAADELLALVEQSVRAPGFEDVSVSAV